MNYELTAELLYSGHTLQVPQDLSGLNDVLPRLPEELPLVVVRLKSQKNKQKGSKDFKVRLKYIKAALKVLVDVTPRLYGPASDVNIKWNRLDHLPEEERCPFEVCNIHATVLDAKGKRMSKSAGNGIDPLEMIDQYGADAVRLSLILLTK